MTSSARPTRWIGLARVPTPALERAELTYLERRPIDFGRACRQHAGYRELLERLGVAVQLLDAEPEHADAVFIEDTAVVLDEIAVLCSMGAASRRGEVAGVATALSAYRDVRRVELPATIDGGDVQRLGRTLYAGLSQRTNRAGVDALSELVAPFGYRVVAVPVDGCLHLKSACTALPDGRLLVNPDWIDARALGEVGKLRVPEAEPFAADVLSLGETVVLEASHARTAALLAAEGHAVETIDLSEFAKAEGGVTCLSLILERSPPG